MEQKQKVAIVFTRYNNSYYIEAVELISEDKTLEMIELLWGSGKVIDCTENWRNFKLVNKEFKDTEHEVFIVVEFINREDME